MAGQNNSQAFFVLMCSWMIMQCGGITNHSIYSLHVHPVLSKVEGWGPLGVVVIIVFVILFYFYLSILFLCFT